MPPQPLSKVKPNAGVALGPGALPMRPQITALVAEVIAIWSEIELQRGRYLAALLGGSQEGSVAMYLAITSAAARRDALDAASKAMLAPEEYELFQRAMKAARSVEKERNEFAHGLWGYSDQIPDGLLLIHSTYRLQHMLQVNRVVERRLKRVPLPPMADLRLDVSKVVVYREADLRRTVNQAGDMHRLTYYLAGLPTLPPGEARDELRLRLSAELPHPKPWM